MTTYDKPIDAARAIAAHLEGFTATADDSFVSGQATLQNDEDGREFMVTFTGNYTVKDRIKIYGVLPRHDHRYVAPHKIDGREPVSEITVARTKTGEQIARDITRRLMPDYIAARADVTEQIRQRQAANDGMRALAEQMCQQLGTTMPKHQPTDTEITLWAGSDLPFYKITVSSADHVRFEHFGCTAEQAARIIRSVR